MVHRPNENLSARVGVRLMEDSFSVVGDLLFH